MKYKIIIGVGAVLLVLIGLIFWLWSKKVITVPQKPTVMPIKIQETLGEQVFEKSQNPIKDKLPETNPFENEKVNPLKDIYTNPFK